MAAATPRRIVHGRSSPDDDESFVRCLLAQYLARVLSRVRRLDHPTLELFVRLLDGELGELPGIIRRRAKDEARHPAVPLDAHFVEGAGTEHLLRILRARSATRPVHILLYGAPGTGKTSALVNHLPVSNGGFPDSGVRCLAIEG